MSVIVECAEFGPDRQFLDIRVELPDLRPGWMVALHAKGGEPVRCPMQPCVSQDGAEASVRFYPFLPPGDYRMSVGLLPPQASLAAGTNREIADIGSFSVPPLDVTHAAERLRSDGAELNQAASRALLPLCVDRNGTPCFWPLRGPSPRPVAVLSIPKSGTYLLAKLLENLGIVNCKVHLTRGHMEDYKLSDVMSSTPSRHLDLAFSSRLVLPGQSVASHTPRELAAEVCLHKFSKLFAYRELRAALVSSFRATRRNRIRVLGHAPGGSEPLRKLEDDSAGFAKWIGPAIERMRPRYEAVSGWYDHPDVCGVAFEDIMGDAGPQRQREVVTSVAAQCGIELPEDQVNVVLERTIGTNTLTSSGTRSNVDEYWTPKSEEKFQASGLDKLNVLFGFH